MKSSSPPPLRSASLLLLLLLFGIGSSFPGCAQFRRLSADAGQAFYQTGFPVHDTSTTLERAFASVMRIRVEAMYDTYFFAQESAPTEAEAGSQDVLGTAVSIEASVQDRAATAVAISRSGGNVSLLTANHALEIPDTVLVFFDHESGAAAVAAGPSGSRRVQTLSIKTRQTNWVMGETKMLTFEILARDAARDLALIGIYDPEPEFPEFPMPVEPFDRPPRATPVLRLAAGDSDRLSWGSFVYVLGFPQGYPMVTRGIVSAPGDPSPGSFRVDDLWNRGMSGGLILAVRGDGQGLEWVGVARGAAATTEVRLVPEEDALPEQGIRRPYEGAVFLEEIRRIDYGITLTIPMTDIRRFLNEQRSGLAARGYVLPRL